MTALARAATVIIPARLASTRFPEKVLADQTGRPMVQHVAELAARAACCKRVVVAADDERIARALAPFGTEVVMTRVDHPNGTSRLAEAAQKLGLGESELVVNAQGDEPEMPPAVLDAATGALLAANGRGERDVGTAAAPLADPAELANPNVVKVVLALDGRALYFSRAPIPCDRDRDGSAAAFAPLRHIGVYAYRVGFLRRYAAMRPTPLESVEKLEQLRVLEHGHSIGVGVVPTAHAGIDTAEQYAAFVQRWRLTRR